MNNPSEPIETSVQTATDTLNECVSALDTLYANGWTPEFVQNVSIMGAHAEDVGWTREQLVRNFEAALECFEWS